MVNIITPVEYYQTSQLSRKGRDTVLRRVRDFLGRLQVVRAPGYKPVLRQYIEMMWLFFRHHLSPTEYFIYQVGRRDASPRGLKDYLITSWAVKEMRPHLNSRLWEPVLRNKILFNQHMSRHGLPVAMLYGLFHRQYGYHHSGGPLKDEQGLSRLLQSLVGKDILIKPVDGLKGSGISRFHVDSHCSVVDPTGASSSCQELASHMDRGNGFLVEECLFNHPHLNRFNPSSLNTCRIVTFVNKGGDCRVLFATARFGRLGHVTDNWSAGGVAVGVDLKTGVMGQGLLLPQFGGQWLDSHPDSNYAFVGAVIPCWPEVMDLVQRAALTLPWCHAIGWDVAVTPQGPVLIEGNGQWNPSIGQAFSGGLLTPQFRKELVELGLSSPN